MHRGVDDEAAAAAELGGEPELVAGLGSDGFAVAGYSVGGADSFSGSACGRTITAATDEHTVQVAPCIRDRDVTTADVRAVAERVLAAR